ncbi:NmrA family transcriptional regulator [Streptomyces sp. NPDC057696]|uniref:NmrA family transcriptional regulator n=1 Tax=unclassified Streptomyces TaxID=2593676 RepID=UPI0036AE885E
MIRADLILVLGGSVKTGSRVARLLTRRGLRVRIGHRSGGTPFDRTDPATWAPALEGARAAYIAYDTDLAAPGAPETICAFAELAVASGARRLGPLSGRGEQEAEAREKAVARSGADWTVLRASWLAQNFSEGHLLKPVLAGEVALPAFEVGEPFVDAADIAEVPAALLTQHGHAGRGYELTGSRLLTFADAVATIAEATGRDILFVSVPADDHAAGLAAEGVPDEVTGLLTYLFTTVLGWRGAHLGDGVQQVLGRPAQDFTTYAHDTATTDIWTDKTTDRGAA